jgi:arsenate reductase (glutaredoxin)
MNRDAMKLKIYEYKNCGTCRKALKYLDEKGINYTAIPIREQPPTKAELKKMLQVYGGQIRKLFNTSGQDYKRLNLKDQLAAMSEEAAIDLLASNGNLVKRPFVMTERGGWVGFDEEEWENLL